MKNNLILLFLFKVLVVFSQTGNKKADALFSKMSYVEAAKVYEKVIDQGNMSMPILKRAGDAYYFNTEMEKANKWYSKLVSEYPEEVSAEYIFRYLQTLEGKEDYVLAKKWMKIYAERAENKDDRAQNFSQEKITIEDILALPQQFMLQNLSINSSNSDFGPMFYKDQLVYATTVDSSYFKTDNYQWNDQPYLNLHLGKINPLKTDVSYLKRFSETINTKYHEAGIAFSPDEKTIYFTRNNYEKKLKRDDEGINHLKLYSAEAEINSDSTVTWKNVKDLPFNGINYSVGHPSVSKDGKKLYFVSDMPGSIGATDIFVVDILGDGKFSKPKNLGESINTSGREMFPYITEEKLYFASDGHLGLGALDVFESFYDEEIFQKPKNLGAPLNSNLDDFAYIVDEETQKGYVCSNRKSGKGDDDIYSFERIVCKQQIKGIVLSELSGLPLASATVKLYLNEKIIDSSETNISGEFDFLKQINCGENYKILASKNKYLPNEKEISVLQYSGETTTSIALKNATSKINTGIIFFDLDKSNIRQDAAVELNKVVYIMKRHPEMLIKIESHTDSRADDDYNLKLSNDRAKATKAYIVSQGIEENRILSAIGYGETRLLNDCENNVPCTKEQHDLNRRSEFIIVRRNK
ncbi:OmpA family protein [Mesonia aquimarina]|uniref:OmpA family protein n=1 Tax=Mesonia aquimarina TaxID=1504967 RepID=UPI000EF57268|nr:OmpA family protein [Mesonia aquimarina]